MHGSGSPLPSKEMLNDAAGVAWSILELITCKKINK